jgi:hypothetical protein
MNIKVIDVKRHITDLSVIGKEELDLVLGIEDAGSSKLSYQKLADLLQSPLSTYQPIPETTDSIICRNLLVNEAATAVIVARGAKATSEDPKYLYVRPSTRIRAIHDETEVSIAAEEPIVVKEIIIDRATTGDIILRFMNNLLDLPICTETGSYTMPVYSVLVGKQLQSMPQSMQGRYQGDYIAATMQLRADLDYHFSGVEAIFKLASSKYTGNIMNMVVPASEHHDTIKHTWRGANAVLRLEYILNAAGQHSCATTSNIYNYDLTPLNILQQMGASHIYLFATIHGRESEDVQRYIDYILTKNEKIRQDEKMNDEATLKIGKARQLMIIIEDRLGSNRSIEILDKLRTSIGVRSRAGPGGSMADIKQTVQVNDPDLVLMALTAREREIVKLEYDNKSKEWAASVNNKCPHIALAYKVHHPLNNRDAQNSLDRLREYFNTTAGTTWIMCKSCGFRIICPHFYDMTIIKLSGGNNGIFDKICQAMAKYEMKNTVDQDTAAYCKICGEKMFDTPAEVVKKNSHFDFNFELKSKIWAMSMRIIPNIQNPIPLDFKNFANNIVETVLPFIIHVETTAIRRRNISDDEIDPRTILYIIIFIYAFILDMIASNPKVGFTGVKAYSKISVYAERMFKHITEDYRSILEQIEDITLDFIKLQLNGAYKLLRQNVDAEDLNASTISPEEELVVTSTTIDPIYRYAIKIAKLNGKLPMIAKSPAEIRNEFETVFGKTLPEIINNAREAAKDPILSTIFQRKSVIEIPLGTTFEFLMKNPKINLYSTIYDPRSVKGGAHNRHVGTKHDKRVNVDTKRVGARHEKHVDTKYVHVDTKHVGTKHDKREHDEREHDKREHEHTIRAYELFVDYTKNIKNRESYDKYIEEITNFNKKCETIRVEESINDVKPYHDFKFSRNIVDVVGNITNIYDENGIRHKWNIFIYEGGLEFEDVKSARDRGKLTNQKLINVKCSVCGILSSETSSLSADKTYEAININFEIDSFYIFYKTRCPIGGIHVLSESSQSCVKCGLISAGDHEYYKKYELRFREQRVELHDLYNHVSVAPIREIPNSQLRVEFPDWTPDFTFIVKAAEFAGTSTTIIEAIGSMEGRPYGEILAGEGIPPPPDNSMDPRIYSTDAETRLIMSDYNIFRNAANIDPLPIWIAEILEPFPKGEWKLLRNLPNIKGDYDEIYNYLRNHKPDLAYKFIIQSICRLILEIAAPTTLPQWVNTAKAEFAKKEIATILRNQKLFSKHGNFNWSIFEVADDQPYDDGDDVESVHNEPDDDFSGEGMDYDISENNPNNDPE